MNPRAVRLEIADFQNVEKPCELCVSARIRHVTHGGPGNGIVSRISLPTETVTSTEMGDAFKSKLGAAADVVRNDFVSLFKNYQAYVQSYLGLMKLTVM